MRKKTKLGFKELMAISILSVGLFGAVFAGVNHVAFAASTAGTTSMPLTPESATIPTISTLSEASAMVASRSAGEARQLNIGFLDWVHLPEGSPTVDCISVVEAAETGVDALERLFGADLTDVTVFMIFWPGSEEIINAQASHWIGRVYPGNEADFDVMPTFDFAVAATGELMFASHDPEAAARYAAGIRGRHSSSGFVATDETVAEMHRLMAIPDDALNRKIVEIAADLASNLLTGTVTRARLDAAEPDGVTHPRGPYLLLHVEVQNENEEAVRLTFRQIIGEEPELIAARGQAETALPAEIMAYFNIARHESLFDWVYSEHTNE
ncbi:MAG: hypothetical protein FWC70_02100 [Defluviitaleaceae bacterium]|nr:hypothetical protein [Defluviitaleaceae bacterium]